MKITKSTIQGKKYSVEVDGKKIHFGASGYRIKPGTDAGNSYCARSEKIKGANDKSTPNYWARQLWSCEGNKSVSLGGLGGGVKLP